MKNFLLLFLSFFIVLSCSEDDEIIDLNSANKTNNSLKDKVDICHYDKDSGEYFTINVSANALDAHLDHGDVVGNCDDVIVICKDGETVRVNKYELENYEPFELGDCDTGQIPGMEYTYVPDDNFERALIDMYLDEAPLDNLVLTENIEGLERLDVRSKNISYMTGIQDFIGLKTFLCSKNNISNLDLSMNTQLVTVYCDNNSLKSLDVSNNMFLKNLYCYRNQINELDLSVNLDLKTLNCYSNVLTKLNLKNVNLINLSAIGNSNLECIQVDNIDFYANNPGFKIDPASDFSLDCWY